jgi:hypothetical protein
MLPLSGQFTMLKLKAWRDRWKVTSALRGYPAYSPPHLRNEIELPIGSAKENFDYFVEHRSFRLRAFQSFLKKFHIDATTDEQGLTSVSSWFRRYGGLLMYFQQRSTTTNRAFINHDPAWTNEHIGINVVWDLGIYVGDCIITRYPSAYWTINTGNADPASLKSLGFQRPGVAGLYWPTECDPITHVFIKSQSMSYNLHGIGHKIMRRGDLVDLVAAWSKAKPVNPALGEVDRAV